MSVYTGLINCLAKNIQCANSKAPLKRGWRKLDLSRICAAPSARLSHLSFKSDRTFPAQS